MNRKYLNFFFFKDIYTQEKTFGMKFYPKIYEIGRDFLIDFSGHLFRPWMNK